MEERTNAYGLVNPTGIEHLGELGVCGRMTLRWILKKQEVVMSTGLNWPVGAILNSVTNSRVSWNGRNFLTSRNAVYTRVHNQ
jgi:hypothetical protein